MTVTPSHTMLPPDIIQVPGGCTLVIVVGKSNFSGSWVVTPISRDPAHFVICISTRTSSSSLGFKYRLVKTTALLNSSLALKVSERNANKLYCSYPNKIKSFMHPLVVCPRMGRGYSPGEFDIFRSYSWVSIVCQSSNPGDQRHCIPISLHKFR